MNIIIVGASGYIGSRLSVYLSRKGYKVTAVCRNIPVFQKYWKNEIHHFIFGDIDDNRVINEIISVKADVIINLVSLDHHESEIDIEKSMKINFKPTLNILDRSINNNLKKYIYFSTIHVYGKNQFGIIDESKEPSPSNFYGLTHNISENICNYYHKNFDINCINIRLSNSYGEPIFSNDKCWNLIVNDLTKSASKNKKIILRSDGSAVRDFIHFSDICNGIDKIININSFNENTFHFSSSKSITMLTLASIVKEIYYKQFKLKIPIYINETDLLKKIDKTEVNSKIDNSLAQKYGIRFNKGIKDGIRDLFNFIVK